MTERVKKYVKIFIIISLLVSAVCFSEEADDKANTIILEAIRKGDIEKIKKIVESGYNINMESKFLCEASRKGEFEIVKYFIEKGANVNKKILIQFERLKIGGRNREKVLVRKRLTPLDLAIVHGGKVVKILKKAGALHGEDYLKIEALNQKGERLYKKKKYREASEIFKKVVNLSGGHYPALYNLTLSYAKMAVPRKSGGCNGEIFHETIYFLKKLIEINRERTIEKAKKDSAFDMIRNYPMFREIIYNENAEKNVKRYFSGKIYTTSTPGSSYYPVTTITIEKNGRWFSTFHENADLAMDCFGERKSKKCDNFQLKIGTQKGTWYVDGNILFLKDEKGKITEKYELKINLLKPFENSDGEPLYYPDPNDMSGDSDAEYENSCDSFIWMNIYE